MVEHSINKPDTKKITNPEKIWRFWERRHVMSEAFLNTPPKDDIWKDASSGAEARVLSSIFIIPEALKEQVANSDPTNSKVTIFIPGLFEAANPNWGNHPLEMKLAASLLKGDADAMMMIKSEGLNAEAFEDGQKAPSLAAQETVLRNLSEYVRNNPNIKNIALEIIGYSEGSSQGASLAARIIENISTARENGTPLIEGLEDLSVSRYLSICGGGLAGPDTPQEVDVIKQIIANTQLASKTNKSINPINQTAPEGNITNPVKETLESLAEGSNLPVYEVNQNLATAYQKSLEVGSGLPQIEKSDVFATQEQEGIKERRKDDITNIGKWFLRFAQSGLLDPNSSEDNPTIKTVSRVIPGGINSLRRLQSKAREIFPEAENSVPLERVQSVFYNNPDYQIIVDSPDTKLTVLAGTEDVFFPGEEVVENAMNLISNSSNPERATAKTTIIKSDIGHGYLHENADGTAYLIETLERRHFKTD